MNDWKKFEKTSTKELVELYQSYSLPTLKQDVFTTLTVRFRNLLLKYCEIRCKNFGQKIEIAEKIAIETFKAYAKNPKFNFNEAKCKTFDDSFLIYLYAIANNKLTDHYRVETKKIEGKWYDGTETIVKVLPDIPDHLLTDRKIHTKYETLRSLSHKHLVIYLTYESHGKEGVNLSRKLYKELREYLGIKQNTIRKYKKEVYDKINLALKVLEDSDKFDNP
jgi:DNA-directed RNA polymerase specialized sigma24 family protein